jgi:hypothetical protein
LFVFFAVAEEGGSLSRMPTLAAKSGREDGAPEFLGWVNAEMAWCCGLEEVDGEDADERLVGMAEACA